jgi:hypothetical protein
MALQSPGMSRYSFKSTGALKFQANRIILPPVAADRQPGAWSELTTNTCEWTIGPTLQFAHQRCLVVQLPPADSTPNACTCIPLAAAHCNNTANPCGSRRLGWVLAFKPVVFGQSWISWPLSIAPLLPPQGLPMSSKDINMCTAWTARQRGGGAGG